MDIIGGEERLNNVLKKQRNAKIREHISEICLKKSVFWANYLTFF